MSRIYLDHAATTPMVPEAVEAMTRELTTGRQRLIAARFGPARRGASSKSRGKRLRLRSGQVQQS